MRFLDHIRLPKKTNSINHQAFITVGILIMGICLGWFSKYLDYRQGFLPPLLQQIDDAIDLHNFLGGFSPWIVIAVCISVYRPTPIHAAIHVFTFFVGFVASYYLYCHFAAGFFPRSYAFLWVAFTFVSPILALICWYAKGSGWVSLLIAASILSVLFNTTFAYGFFYVDIRSWLNFAMLLVGILVLHKSVKETGLMLCMAIAIAIATEALLPFRFW